VHFGKAGEELLFVVDLVYPELKFGLVAGVEVEVRLVSGAEGLFGGESEVGGGFCLGLWSDEGEQECQGQEKAFTQRVRRVRGGTRRQCAGFGQKAGTQIARITAQIARRKRLAGRYSSRRMFQR
jgi:hypothetical protein